MACQIKELAEYIVANKPNWALTKQIKEILGEATQKEIKETVDSTKKITVNDIEKLIEQYADDWFYVIGDDVGYVGDHGVTYTKNYKRKVISETGEFWSQVVDNKTELNVLKKAVANYTIFAKLTSPQKATLIKVLKLTEKDIEVMKTNAEYAHESNYQNALQMSDTIAKDGPELSSEYVKLFKKGTEQFIDATIKIDNKVMLEALRNDVNSVVPGDYNKNSKVIRMIDSELDEKALVEAMQDSYDDAEIKKIKEQNPEQERTLQILMRVFKDSPKLNNILAVNPLVQKIDERLTSKEYKKEKAEYIDKRAVQLANYAKRLDRGHAEVHELVHAAAYKFMSVKQTEPRAKAIQERINLLFEEAKIIAGYTGSKVHDPYWTQNVHEFIAEALSNPEVIRKLEAMPIQNKLSRLSTVLRALVDALVSIVSTSKNKDSVYAYTMDGLMALMEVQKEQQKQEVDIIQPSEVFTKNINKMMKC